MFCKEQAKVDLGAQKAEIVLDRRSVKQIGHGNQAADFFPANRGCQELQLKRGFAGGILQRGSEALASPNEITTMRSSLHFQTGCKNLERVGSEVS